MMEKEQHSNNIVTTMWGCHIGHYFMLDFGTSCPDCGRELKNSKDFQIPDIYLTNLELSYDDILKLERMNVNQGGLNNQSNHNGTDDMEFSQTKKFGSVETFSRIDVNSADTESMSSNDENKITVTKLDKVVSFGKNSQPHKHGRCPNNHHFPMSHGRCTYCGEYEIYKDVSSMPATPYVPAMIYNENGPEELETFGLILCTNDHVYSKYNESCDICARSKAMDSPQNKWSEDATHFNPFQNPVYEFRALGWSVPYGSNNQSKKCERRVNGNGN